MSSSFRYTLTKLRTLPSSLKICLRRSGNCAVRPFSTSPTVAPATVTESCFPVNCRRGVGIKTLAISVDQLLFRRFGLVEVRLPAIGVMEFALLNRKHYERIAGAGIPQVRLRKIRVAVGVRVVDADQIHAALAGRAVGGRALSPLRSGRSSAASYWRDGIRPFESKALRTNTRGRNSFVV